MATNADYPIDVSVRWIQRDYTDDSGLDVSHSTSSV